MHRFLPFFALLLLSTSSVAQTVAPVQLDQPATGTLSDDDPTLGDESHFDLWVLQAEPGTRVRIQLTSNAFDTYLSVGTLDDNGFDVIESNDDYDPPGTDSRLDVRVPTDGMLHIRVNSFSAGESGTYTLVVSAAPNAPVGGVRPIAVATISGAEFMGGETQTRSGGMPVHFWRFDAAAGERYAIVMYSADVDCYLSIGHGEGDSFASIEDSDDVEGGTDSRIIFEPEVSGPVVIRASTFGVETGAYRIAIQRLPAGR